MLPAVSLIDPLVFNDQPPAMTEVDCRILKPQSELSERPSRAIDHENKTRICKKY